jgi:hypothetical protein
MEVTKMQTDKREEGRVNAYVSPEAKKMLTELARQWFPNLHRPVGSALDRIIRDAYAKEKHHAE